MLYPRILNENLFDDLLNFEWPEFRDFHDADRKLYGKHIKNLMKTDVKEGENNYEVNIDLPGFKKDEIKLDLENGYLSVSANKGIEKNEEGKNGRFIRKERYEGSMQRSFYVGDNVKEEDIKAKFEDGVLKLNVPKKDSNKIPEKKTIMIE